MLPPLLSVVAHGNHDTKCAHVLQACMYMRANVRLHVLLHVLYASSVFSDNALFGFFLRSCFRMLAVRTQQIKQNLAQYGLFKT